MVTKASSLCTDMLIRFAPNDDGIHQEVPPEAHALLEVLAVYLTFAIASHTKPDSSDYFTYIRLRLGDTRTRKPARRYSSDSENYPSEVESTDSRDVVVDAADRLQSVCCALGAVPYHPDWLDDECTLWDTVTTQEAIDVAVTALDTLSKLASVASERSRAASSLAVKPTGSARADMETMSLAFDLNRLHHYVDTAIAPVSDSLPRDALSSVDKMDVRSDLSAVCNIETQALSVWTNSSDRDQEFVKQYWMRHLGQRILGGLQEVIRNQIATDLETSELKAGSEWEIIYAGALTGCGVGFQPCQLKPGLEVIQYDFLTLADRWQGVYTSALNGLVPAAALLRFNLRQFDRQPHPLKGIDSSIDDYDPITLVDSPMDIDPPAPASDAIARTVSLVSSEMGAQDLICEAVASNLLSDSDAFNTVRKVVASKLALSCLATIRDRTANITTSEERNALSSFIHAISVVLFVHSGNVGFSGPDRDLSYTGAALGCGKLKIRTVTGYLNVPEGLHAMTPKSCNATVSPLVSCIWRDYSPAKSETRLLFLRTLSMLVTAETEPWPKLIGDPSIVRQTVKAFNDASEVQVETLVRFYICENPEASDDHDGTGTSSRQHLCSLLSRLLSEGSGRTTFVKSSLVLRVLDQSYSAWNRLPMDSRQPVLSWFFLLASNCIKLHDIGSTIINYACTQKCETEDFILRLENLAAFSAYLRHLSLQLSDEKDPPEKQSLQSSVHETPSLPILCSHARQKGFTDQHWYHCFTCGLTGDKGCCTLCALICHRGHEVSYSRSSAFFCDCGAEGGASNVGRGFACKCLTPLSADVVTKAFALGHGALRVEENAGYLDKHEDDEPSCLAAAAIASRSFPNNAGESLKLFIERGESDLLARLFGVMKSCFEVCKPQLDTHPVPAEVIHGTYSYGSIRRSLLTRKASAFLSGGHGNEFKALMSFKTGAFQVKISRDSSVESLKCAMLTTHGACRLAVCADSRGRVAIAESNSILFCSFLPSLNDISSPPESPLSRSSVAVFGSRSLEFNIVGLKLCRSNEANLLVWGTHEASICELNDVWTGCDKVTQLKLGLSSLESGSDFVVQCDWLRGSSTCVLVVCLRSILIFDICGSEHSSPSAKVKVKETSFRGVVAVNTTGEIQGMSWKIFALMENGHVHAFDLVREGSSGLSIRNLSLERKHSIKLPVNGTARIDKDTAPPFSLTLGEGINLSFLEQSGLLLYQAVAESVLALQIDASGAIAASFTLLSKSLSPSLLGNKGESSSITGPYTQWTELGAVRHGASTFFRVSCVGRKANKEPALLCIEFNGSETRVRELPWLRSGLGGSSSFFADGLCSFSAPFCADSSCAGISRHPIFTERVFLASILSNGSLQLFGEDAGPQAVAAPNPQHELRSWTPPGTQSAACRSPPEVPLLAFEELTNISEGGEVLFQGLAMGTDEVRKKLHGDNENHLMSPGIEGFTLSIRPKPATLPSIHGSCQTIVALRILVGATSTTSIPRNIFIAGREFELFPGKKKWYSFLLTPQDIALSVRVGYVTLSVGPTFEASTHPIIDSLECFACDRRKLDSWLPIALQSIVPVKDSDVAFDQVKSSMASGDMKSLYLIIKAFSRFCAFVRPNRKVIASAKTAVLAPLSPSDGEDLKQLLQKVVENTALDDNMGIKSAVDSILASVDLDADLRESFRDRSVLLGCTSFLSRCQERLQSVEDSEEAFEAQWRCLRPRLSSCFRTATQIAKCRPVNYVQSVDEGLLLPGVRAGKFMTKCCSQSSSSMELVADFTELCLAEMAVVTASDAESSAGGRIGDFGGIRSMLLCENETAISLCCATISRFCEKYESPSSCQDCDLFAAQKMVAFYRCDSCGLFPIEDIRFSFNPFDLCQSCYRIANDFASSLQYREDRDVVINNKTFKLSCAEVRRMRPVEIKNEESKASESPVEANANVTEVIQRQQLFDCFMSTLFSETIQLLVDGLQRNCMASNSLIGLAISIVHHSGDGPCRLQRARDLGNELVRGLARTLNLQQKDSTTETSRGQQAAAISLQLRSLAKLIVRDDGAFSWYCLDGSEKGIDLTSESTPSKEAPRCRVHGVAAARRKHTRGSNNGRWFYCCGKDAKSRCKFFLWEDENKSESPGLRPHFDDAVSKIIWEFLCAPMEGSSTSVQEKLCTFVTTFANHEQASEARESKSECIEIPTALVVGIEDGAFCSRSRLQDIPTKELLAPLYVRLRTNLLKGGSSVDALDLSPLHAALSLLALVATPEGGGSSTWSPLLCEVILSSQESSSLTQVSKRALLQLCGMKKGLYVSIRAHYTFSFHRSRHAKAVREMVQEGLLVTELARQSGSRWKTGKPRSLGDIKAGDLIGTEDLVSEDILTLRRLEEARRVLVDLINVAKKRPDHWRKHCGSRAIASDNGSTELLNVPPIILLFSIACLLQGDSQVKALRLVDLALSFQTEKGEGDESNSAKETTALPFASVSTPEKILDLTVDEALSFVLRFGCHGSSAEIRGLACSIVTKICAQSNVVLAGRLFERLLAGPLCKTGDMGKCHSELLSMLQGLLGCAGVMIDVAAAAKQVQRYWKQQMHAIRFDRTNQAYVYFETRSTTTSQRKRFELCPCAYCQQQFLGGRKEKAKPVGGPHGDSSLPSTSISQRPNSGRLRK